MEKLDVRPVRGEGAFSDYYQGFRAQLDTELSWLWDRVGDVATLVNEACTGERAKLVPAQFMRSHVWLGHRLLNFAPLSNTHPLNRIQSMAYLGLVTLISSFICGLDRRVVENPILSELIHNETSLGADPETRELYLWLLFIGGAVMLQDPSHDVWLLPRMWETMQALRLHTWDDTRRVLLRFPWINDFYGEKASSLYTRATIYGRL